MFAECDPVICHLVDDGKRLDSVALGSQPVSTHLEALLYRCNTAYKSSTCLTDYIYKPGKCASVSKEVIDYKDGVLTLSGLEAGTPISLYTIDGRLLQAHTVADDCTYRQSLASLRQGVYVVKVNHKSYKIMKR